MVARRELDEPLMRAEGVVGVRAGEPVVVIGVPLTLGLLRSGGMVALHLDVKLLTFGADRLSIAAPPTRTRMQG